MRSAANHILRCAAALRRRPYNTLALYCASQKSDRTWPQQTHGRRRGGDRRDSSQTAGIQCFEFLASYFFTSAKEDM